MPKCNDGTATLNFATLKEAATVYRKLSSRRSTWFGTVKLHASQSAASWKKLGAPFGQGCRGFYLTVDHLLGAVTSFCRVTAQCQQKRRQETSSFGEESLWDRNHNGRSLVLAQYRISWSFKRIGHGPCATRWCSDTLMTSYRNWELYDHFKASACVCGPSLRAECTWNQRLVQGLC